MPKVLPVKSINLETKLAKVTPTIQKTDVPKVIERASAVVSVAILTPLALNYQQSFDENYFKLPINADDKKPYEADVFQKAAAMNLYEGKDVLVTAPTGTGKTAIAKYIITKNLNEGKKTFYTTPLKALSNEKYKDFCKTYGENNVGLLTGDIKLNPDAKVVVMTTEIYRNMAAADIFNYQDKNDKFGIPKDLKTVIFDELQYLGDVDRGGIWEQAIMFTPANVQLLSLSATVGNNTEINNWLALTKGNKPVDIVPKEGYLPENNLKKESVLINVPTENRHVPLNFEVTHAAAEMNKPRGGTKSQKLQAKKEAARKSQTMMAVADKIAYRYLTKKLAEEDKLPAIYFIFNKKECRHLLKYLSEESEILTTEKERTQIAKIIEEHIKSGEYLGENLNTEALMKGYAIHNAGLLPSQKSLIEELFQKKLVKVVLATETLSAGINMPARTTVISSPRKPASTSDGMNDHKRNLTPNEFHQMAGRAGRRGIDTTGYCYAMSCNPMQNEFLNQIINSAPNRLDSNMDFDYSFIASYLAEFNNDDVLKNIFSKSLYVYDSDKQTVDNSKLQKLMGIFHIKKDILLNEKFITEDGKLTLKGELLKGLNGYAQVPIINMLTDKRLASLDTAELVGVIGGLANLSMEEKEDLPEKYNEIKPLHNQSINYFVNKLGREITRYNSEIEGLYKNMEIKADSKTVEHLYTWANMNEQENDSKKNWKAIVKGETNLFIKEEGTLYKEISLTVDLIKQLIKITRYAESISTNQEDSYYFQTLSEKLAEGLSLIQRKPMQEGINN